MRLRTPPKKVDCPTDWQAAKPENEHRFRVTLVTPMYGGGVKAGEPDADMPIRVSAIRGQLRFWWRLLNRAKHPDGPALFRAERDVWGGLGGNEKDVKASKVLLRIESQLGRDKFVDFDKAGIPSYAIAVARTGKTDNPKVLKSGATFDLVLTRSHDCSDDEWKSVDDALRWWACFGGLGARTRRGLGAVAVEGITPVTQDEAERMGCRLVLDGNVHTDSIVAWTAAVKKLADFRQSVPLARRAPLPGSNSPGGRSHWPEPDAIRRITNTHRKKSAKVGAYEFTPQHPAGNVFPRAFFGLPIIFHFKNIKADKIDEKGKYIEYRDQCFDPYDVRLRPAGVGCDRMASPLIVRPYRLVSGQFVAAALRLPTDHLDNLALQLENAKQQGNRQLRTPATLPRVAWWPLDPLQALALATFSPLANRAPDPLDAFLHYFEKG